MTKVAQLLANGSRACQRGDWRDAKHLYIDALRINRNLVGALHGLGWCAAPSAAGACHRAT